jgi:hypothetical protein
VNITKTLTLSVAACAIGSGVANAQFSSFDFSSSSFGNYRQIMPTGGSEETYFEAGAFSIDVRDGNAVYTPPGCFSFTFFNPSIPCPLGATGYVVFGDFTGDGINDSGVYFSISQITSAAILQPFAPSDAKLISAPPSLLPRPLSGFVDESSTLYYNLFSSLIQKYDITILELDRVYNSAERNTFDREIVPGTYLFNFKKLVNPFSTVDSPPVALELNLFPALDGFRKINNVKQGFRFKNVIYQDGFALLDPLELNTLEWEGNTISFIAPAADLLYLSIKPLDDPDDPTSDAVTYNGLGQFELNPLYDGAPSGLFPGPFTAVDADGDYEYIINSTLPLFPTFAGPNVTRVYLPIPLVQEYILPPNFIAPGQTGVIDLEFILNRPTTAVIADRSTRRFRLPVRIVTIFRTAIAARLPATATALQKSENYDYDGDGSSNFAEWAFGSDPANASSSPSFSSAVTKVEAFEVGISTRDGSDATPESGLRYEIAKLVNPVPALTYSIEFSSDMKTWETVSKTDPRFKVIESPSKLCVTTVGNPEGGGFFRSKVVPK